MIKIIALASLLTANVALAADVPWYERPSCHEVVTLAMTPDFAGAEAKLVRLERSADPEDQACALWTRASWSEFQISILGKTGEWTANRKKAISRLFGFAKAHKGLGPRFADLELEARLRRVRVLNEEGQKTQALDDIKQIQKLLETRGTADPTPALDYTQGVLNAAMSSPGWAARALLSVVGVGSDPAIAAKHLHRLIDGTSVYKWDASYIAQFFGAEIGGDQFRATAKYVGPLGEKFPANPLFAYERALVLIKEKKAKDAVAVLEPLVAKIDADPAIWGAPARARVLWAAGRAACDSGDKAGAKKRAIACKAEKVKELDDRLDDLFDDLD